MVIISIKNFRFWLRLNYTKFTVYIYILLGLLYYMKINNARCRRTKMLGLIGGNVRSLR